MSNIDLTPGGVGCIAWLGLLPTPRASRALATAAKRAREKRHSYLGMEHLLLGLLEVDDGAHVEILRRIGLDPAAMREKVRIEYELLHPVSVGDSRSEVAARLRRLADELMA